MRTHSRLATDNRRQDTVHRRANNAVEKLLTLAALTKLLFVCLLGGHVRVSGDLRRLTLIVTMSNKLSKREADQLSLTRQSSIRNPARELSGPLSDFPTLTGSWIRYAEG